MIQPIFFIRIMCREFQISPYTSYDTVAHRNQTFLHLHKICIVMLYKNLWYGTKFITHLLSFNLPIFIKRCRTLYPFLDHPSQHVLYKNCDPSVARELINIFSRLAIIIDNYKSAILPCEKLELIPNNLLSVSSCMTRGSYQTRYVSMKCYYYCIFL